MITAPSDPRGSRTTELAVEVRGLTKTYGHSEAVGGIDIQIAHGEIFAFLGPNGAGKTTTVEILEGFRSRDDGEVSVLGVDPKVGGSEWRDGIGMVLQESAPEPGLTVRESLQLYAGYFRRPRSIDESIALVGLDDKRNARAESLSGGQRRRLDLGLALIGDPDLIFLDEPTTGFDPSARHDAWDAIDGLRSLGKTIFLTTHYMEEAERLADRVAVIVDGRIVAEGTPTSIGDQYRRGSLVSFSLPPALSAADLPSGIADRVATTNRAVTTFHSEDPLRDVERLAAWARERSVGLPDLQVTRPSLEDIYLRLTTPTREE